jgi:hypothetical protein
MAKGLFAQPYITSPDYDMVEFLSKKDILLAQKSVVQEYERRQQCKSTARREESPQQVEDCGMKMIYNAL